MTAPRRAAALALATALAGCGGEASTRDAAMAARGRAVFFGSGGCSACHSVAGEGGRIVGPDLGGLTDPDHVVASVRFPDAVVTPGYAPGVMPTLPVSEADLRALATFLTGPRPVR